MNMRNSYLNGSAVASLESGEYSPTASGKRLTNGNGGYSITPPKQLTTTPCSQSTLTVTDSNSLISSGLRPKVNQKRISGSGTTVDGSQLSLKLQTNLIQSVKKSLAKTKRQWDRTGLIHIIYVFVLLAYSFLGGALFMALDGPNADRMLAEHQNRCVDKREQLWNELLIICNNRSFTECENLTRNAFDSLDGCLRTSAQIPFNHSTSTSNYWNSLIYAITVFTTIGYGNIVVLSTEGRIAMILYAMIGIPLFFAFLNDMGQWFHFKFLRIYDWVRKKLVTSRLCTILTDIKRRRIPTQSGQNINKIKDHHKTDKDSNDGLIFTFAVAVLVFYLVIVCGLFMIMVRPQWSFLQAFYFIFQSISLIGFGDEFPDNPNIVLINITFIIIGIILLSMCFFILQEWIRGKTYRLSTHVRRSVRRWRHYRPANNAIRDRRRTLGKSTRFTMPHLGSGTDRGWRRSGGRTDENTTAGQRLAIVDDCSPGPGRRTFVIQQHTVDGDDQDESAVPKRAVPTRRDGVNSTDETLITGRTGSTGRPSITSSIGEIDRVKFLTPQANFFNRGARDRRHTFMCRDDSPGSLLETGKRRVSWIELDGEDPEDEEDGNKQKPTQIIQKRLSFHDRPARFGKFQWMGQGEEDEEDEEESEMDDDTEMDGNEENAELIEKRCVFVIDDGDQEYDGSSLCERDVYL